MKAVTLNEGDTVVAAFTIGKNDDIALLTDRGFGKRVMAIDIPVLGRASKGVKVFTFVKKSANGTSIKAAYKATPPFEMQITQKSGLDSTINTSTIALESLASPGKQLALIIMDDEVIRVAKLPV